MDSIQEDLEKYRARLPWRRCSCGGVLIPCQVHRKYLLVWSIGGTAIYECPLCPLKIELESWGDHVAQFVGMGLFLWLASLFLLPWEFKQGAPNGMASWVIGGFLFLGGIGSGLTAVFQIQDRFRHPRIPRSSESR
jgi:hypothetical protein